MKTNDLLPLLSATAASSRLRAASLTLLAMSLALGPALKLRGADVTWTGGMYQGPNPSYWQSATNWNGGVAPGSTDTAILGTGGSTNSYIEFNSTAASVGSITLSSALTAHNEILRSQSASAVLNVYAVNDVLIANASSMQLQFMASGGTLLTVRLAGSGSIGGVGPMLFYAPIGETGGSYGFTKTGANVLTLSQTSASSYSGGTTITAGAVRLGATSATLGSGPIYLAGGDLVNGLDRGAVPPLPNSVVVSANSRIYSDSASANSTRNIIFSGEFSGSAGTLTIQNLGTVANITNVVRLTGGCNFSRDVVVGAISDAATRYSILALANSASSPQTFSGKISGTGSVRRELSGGTTTFTGANTYSGGTTISAGTLLANNASGSATGSGAVTVQNTATLGGTGTVGGTVSVQSGGTLAPGSEGIGTLTLNASPSLSGGVVMEIDRAASPKADKLVVGGAALACGGTLTVNNIGGALTGGETFDLFDVTSMSGLFTATNLPSLNAGLNWWTALLGTDGTIKVNGAPTASNLAYARVKGTCLKIHKADITATISDPDSTDGDSASYDGLVSTGSQGATVTEYPSFILYEPANDNSDTLQYRVKDTRGGITTRNIQINAVAETGQGTPEVHVSGGAATVSFAGIPGLTYVVQRSTDMVDWKNIRTNAAPANGVWSVTDNFNDLAGPPSSAYYRLQRP